MLGVVIESPFRSGVVELMVEELMVEELLGEVRCSKLFVEGAVE